MTDELEAFVNEGETDATVETTADSQATEPETEEVIDEVAQPDTPSEEPEGETGEPPSPEDKSQEQMIPLAAKQAEKEKRKKAEERARELELELARLQGQQTTTQKTEPEDPKPDPYTHPEEYAQWHDRQRNKQAALQNQQVMKARINAAEEIARSELTDYDKYADYFSEIAKTNPDMIQQMMVSPDPARFAYYKGKAAMEKAETETQLSQYGSVDAMKEAIRNEILAEMQEGKKPDVNVPPNMATARNAGSDPDDTIADGKEGLNALLGR